VRCLVGEHLPYPQKASDKSIEYLDLGPQGAYERVSLRTLELALTKEPNNKKTLKLALTKEPNNKKTLELALTKEPKYTQIRSSLRSTRNSRVATGGVQEYLLT
jgi:hypothetical protein